MAFYYFNRNIPDEAHTTFDSLGRSGVQAFAFTPSGGWVIVTNNGYFARGIPDECFEKLGEFIDAKHKIHVIAFPPHGGNSWVIVTDKTYCARNIPDECLTKLGEFWNAGAIPTCIAFPYPGGNRWVIVAGKNYFPCNIDDECFQLIQNFAEGLRPVECVAFTKSGGFALLAKDRFLARRIPEECHTQMQAYAANGWALDFVNFTSSDGFSILSNSTRPAYVADKLRDFETHIAQDRGKWQNIWQCMASYKVPGMSVAVVQGNQLAWACSYGRVEAGSSHWVHNDTVFQAASCAKPVAAVGFLHLVQSGLIGLDEDVNPKLDWTLPMCASADPTWKTKVNLRRLLQHRGGIIGRGANWPADAGSGAAASRGGWFRGYGDNARVGLPTLIEILDGTSSRPRVRVNSHRAGVTYKPGTKSAYSGEGYVLMMQLLEQLRGTKFADWMKPNVLDACGMLHSTFSLNAPSHSGPPASGHSHNGVVIAGKRRRYPESAAAGLYTTAADLCRFIIMLNQEGEYAGASVLEKSLAEAMVKEGLGPKAAGTFGTSSSAFWHGGVNAGFRAIFKGYPGKKGGFAILTNSNSGFNVSHKVAAALIRSYGWE